jgi:hypothetical protein
MSHDRSRNKPVSQPNGRHGTEVRHLGVSDEMTQQPFALPVLPSSSMLAMFKKNNTNRWDLDP